MTTSNTTSFINGGAHPLIAFFGFGAAGTIILMLLYFLSYGQLLPIFGPERSLEVLLVLFAILIGGWSYLGVGIVRSLLTIGSAQLKYLAIFVFLAWSVLCLGGILAAVLVPVIRYSS